MSRLGYNHEQKAMREKTISLLLIIIITILLLTSSSPSSVNELRLEVSDNAIEWISTPGWLRGLSTLRSMDLDRHIIEKMLVELSEIELDKGDPHQAEKILQEARIIFPNQAEILYRLGLVTTVTDPGHAMQYLTIAATMDEAFSVSIEELEHILNEFTGSDIQNGLDLGRMLETLDEWKLAALVYQEVLRQEARNPDALALMGNALEELGKDGYPYLSLASEIAPDSVLVRAMLAVYWQLHDRPDKAISYLFSLSEDFPEESIWQENIALVYLQEEEIVDAYDHFVAAVNLEPNDPDLWLELARFCIQYNIYIQEVGLPSAREALVLAPNFPEALMVMGQVLMLAGDADNSVLFLQRAYELDPTDPAITYFLAGAFLSAGRSQASFDHYVETITLAGENSYGLAARQMLEQFFSPVVLVP